MSKIKVLLAEDEPSLGLIIKESLETKNFIIDLCENGLIASKQFHQSQPDICVLDVMMPELDGFSLAKEIRSIAPKIPIIFLTSKSETKDVVEGFQSGGNDYIKKPFSMEELIIRIESLLGRIDLQNDKKDQTIGIFKFVRSSQILSTGNDVINLTHKENELLHHLYINKNQLLDRSVILKKLWGEDDFFNARSMDVYISKLRKKLKADPNIKIINVRGYGYKLIC